MPPLQTPLDLPVVDLGSAPPSNAYLTAQTCAPEKWFPLRVLVCEHCWLVQTEDFAQADELFDADYAYFSGFSSSWLAHCRALCGRHGGRFGLNADSHVVEVAANDGYLLQYVKARNIPCTGVEPTASTAAAARAKGIPIVEDFFGVRPGRELVGRGQAGRPHRRQQCARPCAGHQRFRGGLCRAAQAAGRGHLRVPAPAAA